MDHGLVTGLNYIRGQLYLEQRMGSEAAADFSKIIDKPGCRSFIPGMHFHNSACTAAL